MERTLSSYSLEDPEMVRIESRIRAAIDGYAAALVPFIGKSYGSQSIQQAWREFMPEVSVPFTGDDIHGEIFFSWLFHCWSPRYKKGSTAADPGLNGIPPTRAFLRRYSSDLNPVLRRYLEACLEAPFGFYQITECRPEMGFRARDLSVEMRLEVLDKVASSSLRNGEIIFARVPLVNGICMMDAIAPVSFPPSFQRHLVQHKLESTSNTRSDGALLKVYFELLEIHLRGGQPEICTRSAEVIDTPAAHFRCKAPAHATELIFGPEPERGEAPTHDKS